MYHFGEFGKSVVDEVDEAQMTDELEFQPAHCRSARALLGWTQAELASVAGVGRMTVKRFESGEALRPAQAKAIRGALEQSGVALIGDGATWGDRTVRVGVAMVAGREPDGWTPGERGTAATDGPGAASDE